MTSQKASLLVNAAGHENAEPVQHCDFCCTYKICSEFILNMQGMECDFPPML